MAPFVYRTPAGAIAHRDPHSGMFPQGSTCSTSAWVRSGDGSTTIVYYATGGVLMLLCACLFVYRGQTTNEVPPEVKAVMVLHPRKWAYILLAVGLQVAAGQVVLDHFMGAASVAQFDGVQDALNFVQPFGDLFTFFEDALTVLVGHAVGAGQLGKVGALTKWGILVGVASGCVAAGISTGAAYAPAIFGFMTNSGDASVLTCTAGGPGGLAELRRAARAVWVLRSWAWPAAFAQKATIGLFLGTGETKNYLIASVVSATAQLAVYFGGCRHAGSEQCVDAYAASQLAYNYAFVAVAAVLFTRPHYWAKFHLGAPMLPPPDAPSERDHERLVTRAQICSAGRQGAILMAKDLLLILQFRVAFVLATHLGLGQQYEFSIMNVLSQNYGYSGPGNSYGNVWAITLGYIFRITGSKLYGARLWRATAWFFRVLLRMALLFGLAGCAAVLVGLRALPFAFAAKTLCKLQVAPPSAWGHCDASALRGIYSAAVGPDSGLAASTYLLAGSVVVGCVFVAAQYALYAVGDFFYLLSRTAAVFALVFVPAAAVAYHRASVVGLLVAVELPLAVLSALFLYRLYFRHIAEWDRLQPPLQVGWCEFREKEAEEEEEDGLDDAPMALDFKGVRTPLLI